MKAFCLVLSFLLVAPFASAEEFFAHTIQREVYAPGETVQITLTMLQQPRQVLTALNFIFHDSTSKRVPVAPFFTRIDENMYSVYFTIPSTTNNGRYQLLAHDVPFIVNNTLRRVSYAIPVVVEQHTPTLSIFPGVVVPRREQTFTIKTTTGDEPAAIRIKTSKGIANVYTTEQPLLPRTERVFRFSLTADATREESVEIAYGNYSYAIPVLLQTPTEANASAANVSEPVIELLSPLTSIDREMEEGESVEGEITLRNHGEVAVPLSTGLEESLRSIMTVDAPSSLAPMTTTSLMVRIDAQQPLEDSYAGTLTIRAGTFFKALPVSITIVKKVEQLPANATKRPEETPKEPELFEVNLTSVGPLKEERSKAGLVIFLFLLLVAALALYLFSRRSVKRKSFQEYVEKIEKK